MEFKLKEKPEFKIKSADSQKQKIKIFRFMDRFKEGFGGGFYFINKGSSKSINLYSIFYAEETKDILGACALLNYGENLLLVYYIYVLKTLRRQGVGAAIIKAALNHASKTKIQNILSFSLVSDKEARKFLKKEGFKKAGKVKHFFNGKDCILWEYLP